MGQEKYSEWAKIYPNEMNIRNFSSNTDCIALKVNNVVRMFQMIEFNYKCYSSSDNHFIFDDKSKEAFILDKSMNLLSIIFYLNCCIDYAYQIFVFYCIEDKEDNYEHSVYESYLTYSDIENYIKYKLSLGKNIDCFNLKILLEELSSYINKWEIRKRFNYIKHRGIYHFKGLGSNNKTPLNGAIVMTINGEEQKLKPMLYLEELDLEKFSNELFGFKKDFEQWFDKLIKIVIPEHYVKEKISLEEFINNNFYQ